MPRHVSRHDRDAGGAADLLAAKAALREEVWQALRAAKASRFPGAAGRIPNFAGAEAAAERLRSTPEWHRARTVKANPDSAQLPVRQRALQDGKTVYIDLEYALASAAGLIGSNTIVVTTVHELQVRPAGSIPATAHDVPVDLIVSPERIIDCRASRGPRPRDGIRWDELTEEKIAAIPLLSALRSART